MILKLFYIICLFIFLKFSHSYSIPNILEDNYDLKVLKNYLIENNNSYYPEENSKKALFNLTQLQAIENNLPKSHPKGYSSTVKNFYLFTRDYRNGSEYEIIHPRNLSSIKYCHFATKRTYVLVHGFIGYGLESWIITLKEKLLSREDCNVISVDWPAGSKWFLPTYITAAYNVPPVGNETAKLLDLLIQLKGLLLRDVHCIGHSLGGHVCGFAGKPFHTRLGRISGLDPAGPLFHHLRPSQRLDRKDAIYVDVMHTNACVQWPYWTDCYGLNENIGHSNFFPNGGEHQPGCVWAMLRGNIGCDHERAYLLYIFSMDFNPSGTYFLARPCDNWNSYVYNNCSCGKTAQFMGTNVNTELDGNFYLKTYGLAPYALQDPQCSSKREVNVLVLAGYTILFGFVVTGLFFMIVIAVANIRKACCSPPTENCEPLFSRDNYDDGEYEVDYNISPNAN